MSPPSPTPLQPHHMGIQRGLYTTISKLSDQNYDQSFPFYRFWFDIAQAHSEVTLDQIFDAIWDNRGAGATAISPRCGKLILPNALLALRFTGDAESDSILAPHSVGLRIRLCAKFLKEFFEDSMTHADCEDQGVMESGWEQFYTSAKKGCGQINTNF